MMMNTDKIYAEQLANEYAPKDTSKVIALRKLDARAKLPATIFTYTFGIITSLITGVGMCIYMNVIGSGTTAMFVLCAAIPDIMGKTARRIQSSRIVKRISSVEIMDRYLADMAFRGNISIYQGMAVNFLYTIFRTVTGICYASVWFIAMAVYYLVLGIIRAYLIVCYKQRHVRDENICYRNTAWFLFLLNVPMGGMILLMIRTNSGFSYPGYVIYLSALYTFYTLIIAVRNLAKFRRVGSPILSAAKVLNFIAAMMSILGLQTAMIAQFSVNGGAGS